jgi:hypothetical protein
MESKQRLTSITKEQAERFEAEGMGAPTVFVGDDGSYWVLSEQLRDYASTHTSEGAK